mmetsp:Transcript_9053/g.30861  ORF Transcript_9053/g.30861 Transcript_9053/m.30861 type:complete len:245 (-) Transcript_9053:640-1374(-)
MTTHPTPPALYCRATSGTLPVSPVKMFFTALVSPVSAFSAPMRRLLEMLSRWPRNLSQGPAMLMWSVVHLPLALMSTGMSTRSPPSQASKASRRARRWEAWSTTTSRPLPSGGGAWNVSSPLSNPDLGSSSPEGGENLNLPPEGVSSSSVRGSKSSRPAMVRMVVTSGEVTNACVPGLPSLRLAKLRLYDVTIVFASPCFSERFHWPMQGPQALARTVAPAFTKDSVSPSRVMVARTCSLPGVT